MSHWMISCFLLLACNEMYIICHLVGLCNPKVLLGIWSLNRRGSTCAVNWSVKELDIVLVVVVREGFKIFFWENTESCVNFVEILFPMVTTTGLVHPNNLFLFLLRMITKSLKIWSCSSTFRTNRTKTRSPSLFLLLCFSKVKSIKKHRQPWWLEILIK